MNISRAYWAALLLALSFWTSTDVANATEDPEPATLKLPAAPVSWINTPPLTIDMLKGKAALFYLFEEG